MKEKVCFSTYIYSDHYMTMAERMMRSCKYFHPDIPIEFMDRSTLEKFKSDNNISQHTLSSSIGLRLLDKYDRVIHIDADSIVTAPQTEALELDYDFAAVKNNNHFGKAGFCGGFDRTNLITGEFISKDEYLNTGFHAATSAEFLGDWERYGLEYAGKQLLLDQDVMNDVFYSGKYNCVVLDPPEAPYYYGVANTWGISNHYESWRLITIQDDKLMLNGKQVKVLHAAGGPETFDKFKFDLMFRYSVERWLKDITGEN